MQLCESVKRHRNYVAVLILNSCYYARMRRGNAFDRVCLSTCVSVCPVCILSFESLDVENSFFLCRYIYCLTDILRILFVYFLSVVYCNCNHVYGEER